MRVAAVQMDIKILEKDLNLQNVLQRLEDAARQRANLVVFPECALTGYCFTDFQEAWPLAEVIPGTSSAELARAAKELDCTAVLGLLERENDRIYNSAVVVGPDGILGVHRKVHMPYLGIDRFASPGNLPFPTFQAGECRFGINICFDCSFPESARVLKLKGAQLLVVSTDWPGSSDTWKHTPKVRAAENHMFAVVADRIGTERGFAFAGHSQILDCEGHVLAEAGDSEEAVLLAEIDPTVADQNRIVRLPGQYEFDRIGGRRPEMYDALRQEK
jgi:predicted amidohydrolase